MANEAKKDQAEAKALEAVEDALSIDFGADNISEADLAALEEKLSDVTSELQIDDLDAPIAASSLPSERLTAASTDSEPQELDLPDAPPAAANDAHDTELANLLYAMQQKPSNNVFLWTAILSLLWVVTCGFFAYQSVSPDLIRPITFSTLSQNQSVLFWAAVTILPLLPLWAFAYMIRRALEMRNAARSITTAAVKLLQPENVAVQSIASVGGAIRREVAAIGNGVEQAIARANELESMVQREVFSLERSYGDSEDRLKKLVDEITHEREEVVNHAEKLRQSIENTQTNFVSEMKDAGTQIEERVKSATSIVTDSLYQNSEAVTARFSEQGHEISKVLEGAGSTISESLVASKTMIGSEVAKRAKEMSDVINMSGNAVAQLLDTRVAQISQSETQITERLETGQQAFDKILEKRKAELNDVLTSAGQTVSGLIKESATTFAQQSEAAIGTLSANSQALEASVSQHVENVNAAANNASERLTSAMDTRAEEFEKLATSSLTNFEDSLSIRASDLESALGMRTEALGKVLDERTKSIGDTIASRLSGFGKQMTGHVDDAVNLLSEQTSALQAGTKSVGDLINKQTHEFAQTMQSAETSISETLVSGAKSFSDTVGEKQEQLDRIVDGNLKMLENAVSQNATQIASGLTQGIDQLNNSISSTTNSALSDIEDKVQSLGNNVSTVANKLTETTHHLGETITSKSGEALENINAAAQSIEDNMITTTGRIAEGASSITASMEAKTGETLKRLDDGLAAIDESLQQKSDDIDIRMAAGNQLMEQTLANRTTGLMETVAQSIADAGNAIDVKAGKISDLLETRAEKINNSLGSSLLETQRSLEEKTGEFNSMLHSRSTELQTIIENDAKPIVESLQTIGDSVADKISNVSRNVLGEANALFSNLGASTEQIEKLIADSGQALSALQIQLSEQTANLGTTLNSSASNLQNAQHQASETQQNLQAISDNIVGQMSEISERLYNQSGTLQNATQLIEGTQANLQETLETKQATLEQIATGLVSHTSELNQTMQTFGNSVSAMVEDISDRSKTVGGTVAGEISNAIEDATSRFNDSVEAMRGAAATMRDELEMTREQMRRVVTDQIAALRELSAIVERSGKMFDATPAAAPITAPTQMVAAPAPRAAPRPQTVARPFPPQTASVTPSRPAPAPRKAPVAQAPLARPAPAQRSTEQGSGWVSDLLRRASEEPATPVSNPRSAQHVVESLNSLSMDIANAIDHETSVDLWERYQRGETNVFTKRLYTLQGQQTFDEIQSKYVNDIDFKMAVDRYVDDFEQLLQDASNNDATGVMAQTYLTSDTGKVYTMLAHASGRIGN